MWGNVLTGAFFRLKPGQANPKWGSGKSEKACGHANSLTLSGLPEQIVKENKNDEKYQDEQLQNPGRSAAEPGDRPQWTGHSAVERSCSTSEHAAQRALARNQGSERERAGRASRRLRRIAGRERPRPARLERGSLQTSRGKRFGKERQVLLCRPAAQPGHRRAVSALAAGGDCLFRDPCLTLQGDDGGTRGTCARRSRSEARNQ